jgi:hypothetical protein
MSKNRTDLNNQSHFNIAPLPKVPLPTGYVVDSLTQAAGVYASSYNEIIVEYLKSKRH